MLKLSWDESTNKDLLKGTLEKLFDTTDRAKIVEYPNIFKDIKTDEYYIRRMRIAGLPQGGEIGLGENIPTYDPVYGGTLEFTQKRFGWGFTITDAMKRFEQYDLYAKFTRDLKKTMWEMKDVEVFKLINNPTSTTYGAGYDTFALAYDDHTCLDDASTTYDNKTTSDLSVSSFEDGTVYFDTIVDDQGQINPGRPNKLIVPPQLRVEAMQLMAPGGVPFEFSNTKNVFPDWDLTLFVAHRMTDDDAWFMADTNHEDYGLLVITAQDPDIVVQDAPNTSRNTYVTSQQHFEYGFDDARYIYASIPA